MSALTVIFLNKFTFFSFPRISKNLENRRYLVTICYIELKCSNAAKSSNTNPKFITLLQKFTIKYLEDHTLSKV